MDEIRQFLIRLVFKIKKAIVTGANGFIGSHVVRELLKHNIEVIAVVKNKSSNIKEIAHLKGLQIVYCELSNVGCLREIQNVDTFYHFAWEGVGVQDRNNYSLQLQNAMWTAECINVASQMGCKRFVNSGSVMEKEALAATYSQGNKMGLSYIYGAGKVAAHTISKAIASDLGIELLWGNITNAYGVGEVSSRFINTTLRKIISEEPLYFTSGNQNYDFIYIDDVARAFYLIGEKGKPFYDYTIGSGEAKPLKQFILEIKETLASERTFSFGEVPFTGVNIGLEQFNINLLKEHTGFKPSTSFKEGIIKTIEWLKTL